MENNKILTEDMIPKGYYWAAVEPDGAAYAFKEIPRLSVDYNSWESNEGSGHVIIGKNFDTSNWKKSLICFDLDFKVFFDDLTVDDIPDGYNYIAIDSFSSVYAYINEPVKSYDYWEKTGEEIYKQIGVHLGKFDWEDSLVSRVSDTKFKTLTEVDIPVGFKYAVITKAGTAVATVVAPRLTKWGWDFREGELKVIGEGYDFTDWQNSFISRGVIMESNPTKLTADDIPEGFNYAAVDSCGTAFAYRSKPVPHNIGSYWASDVEDSIEIEGYFDASDWKNSLVSREPKQNPELKKLTASDIPVGFNFAAVDSDGRAFAYTEEPKISLCGGGWKDFISSNYPKFIGKDFDVKDWKNSLVTKIKKPNPKQLTADDIPQGYNYAVINSNGIAFATKGKPIKHSYGWNFVDTLPFVELGGNYDTKEWSKSLVSRETNERPELEKLTVADIPEGYNYAAIDSDSYAYAYKYKPKLDKDDTYWYYEDFDDPIELGRGYNNTDWQNSLVRREPEQKPEPKKLTGTDIPDGYEYAAVDKDGRAYAYMDIPIRLEVVHDSASSSKARYKNPSVFIGQGFEASDWQNSLVSKEGATLNGVISSFDYSKFNNVSFFDYGKLNSNSFPINNQMEKPTTEISNLSSKFSSFDTTFLKVAEVIAERSKSTRLKVGAVLVKDKRIISTGYNGLVSGVEPDVLEDENGVTKKEVIHAELNCIISCARNGVSCEGSTLYLTHSPCEACAALIAQSGIKKVIFKEYYRDLSGIEKLKSYGVKVI